MQLDLSHTGVTLPGTGQFYGMAAIELPKPKMIALCGAPKAGKTTVAEFLVERYGCYLVDDGMVLRKASQVLFGGPLTDYTTQEGKANTKTICGRTLTNRELLGELGNKLEEWFGDQIMPELALNHLQKNGIGCHPQALIFPSVRKTQGKTYIEHGGFVVEVSRPGCEPVHDFDHYDKSLVMYNIDNSGTMGDLLGQVVDLAEGALGLRPQRKDAFA